MKVVTERMSARSVALGQTKSRLDTHFGRIDSALQAIGNLQHDLEKADPRAAGPCDSAAVERWLAETYTTEVERQVLSATLYGRGFAFPAGVVCGKRSGVVLSGGSRRTKFPTPL